ncbi:hypothetical protein [Amycolatopsis magusensis]|uniref:Uncharacterized protein n=1 Tax=Amycolatopsis magusensis TaxID=882444 RepID=A0ABS4Q107_9PSEU|nr:hypothetical protein [Amycolatopsis magusensis]MBP2185355.1 hypothetical protein [Amycolatopsis magusensis]
MDDPHIHVERKVLQAGADYRNVVASTLGLVADAPTVVTTGCGVEVPYAMTSARPESVTCLACREHGHREHLAMADQIEQLSRMPGIAMLTAEETAEAVRWLQDRAARYRSSGGPEDQLG